MEIESPNFASGVPARQSFGKVTYCAIQMVDGYVGQIAVDGKPVWESGSFDSANDALDEASEHMRDAFANLFA